MTCLFRLRACAAIAVVCLLACFAVQARAQYTTVTTTYLGGSLSLVGSGTLYLQPVSGCNAGVGAARVGASNGQISGLPFQVPVVNGASSKAVPDALQTTPNIAYAITALDDTGTVILGAGLQSDGIHVRPGGPYGCVQPTGTTWSLDTYVPSSPVSILPSTIFDAPSTTTGAPGSSAAVTLSMLTGGQYHFAFTVPQGLQGPQGIPGGSLSYPGVSSDGAKGLSLGAVTTQAASTTWTTAQIRGDSLFCGGQGTLANPWHCGPTTGHGLAAALAALPSMAGKSFTVLAIPGQTSNQTLAVANAFAGTSKQQATITGGSLTSGTPVTITFTSGYEPTYNAFFTDTNSVPITICGVSGTASEGTGHVATFTPSGSAACAGTQQWTTTDPSGPQIVLTGYNDHGSVSQVQANDATLAAKFNTLGLPFLFLSIPYGEGAGPGNYPGANSFWSINNSRAALYGASYVDANYALAQGYNAGNAADVSDHNAGVVPTYTERAVSMQGTLNGALGTTGCPAVVMTSSSIFSLEVNGIMNMAGGEQILVTGVSGTYPNITVTSCLRAQNGTTAASYSSGAAFTATDWLHFNDYGQSLIAAAVAPLIGNVASPNVTLPSNNGGAIAQSGGPGVCGFGINGDLDCQSNLVSSSGKQLGTVSRPWGAMFSLYAGIRGGAPATYTLYSNIGLIEYSNPQFVFDAVGPTPAVNGQYLFRVMTAGNASHTNFLSSDASVNAIFGGGVTAKSYVFNNTPPSALTSAGSLGYSSGGFLDLYGPDASTYPTFSLRLQEAGGAGVITAMTIDNAGNAIHPGGLQSKWFTLQNTSSPSYSSLTTAAVFSLTSTQLVMDSIGPNTSTIGSLLIRGIAALNTSNKIFLIGDNTGLVSTPNGLSTPKFYSTAAQTTTSCGTSGSIISSEPFLGSSHKTVVIHLAACNGAATYTFPTAFANTPGIFASSSTAASVVTSLSASAVTITGTTSTGTIVLTDY
ncbi:hypothetical protein [Occallatibacter riparius]|uniref:Uncharacterized protein n=1 Tax=Occallatibacter riparius TaxID=1002689 RepID=A0A9J7BQ33_9BACT|nr:hypothetical protein [Occallatibacter riparius]UWZ84657.1 hypothetical protein MOP44_01680 [Occallatibacter riparius]